MEECPSWDVQRRVRKDIIRDDLSLLVVVKAMVGSEDAWGAMVSFCEDVFSRKETAEQVREDDPSSAPIRRRKGGARRRAYARLP